MHLRKDVNVEWGQLLKAQKLLIRGRASLVCHIKSFLRFRLQTLPNRMTPKRFVKVVGELCAAHPEGMPEFVQVMLDSFEQMSEQIDKLDVQIKQLNDDSEVCKLLRTMPGVGPKIAVAFVSQVDTPDRFASAEALSSYLALVPGESTTGGKIVRTSTIKAGPTHLKALMIQAAWVMFRCRPNDPLVQWAQRIAHKRNKQVAIMALARKMSRILWAMWKHGASYDPTRAVSRPAKSDSQGGDDGEATTEQAA